MPTGMRFNRPSSDSNPGSACVGFPPASTSRSSSGVNSLRTGDSSWGTNRAGSEDIRVFTSRLFEWSDSRLGCPITTFNVVYEPSATQSPDSRRPVVNSPTATGESGEPCGVSPRPATSTARKALAANKPPEARHRVDVCVGHVLNGRKPAILARTRWRRRIGQFTRFEHEYEYRPTPEHEYEPLQLIAIARNTIR